MFEVKGKAEVKGLNCRTEIHGEDNVPANDIKLMLLDVPVDRIDSLCPEMKSRFYTKEGLIAVGEVNPLTVAHKIENLFVTIGGVEIKGADIKRGAKIHLQPQYKANVLVTVQAAHSGTNASRFIKMLREEVAVKLSERQLDAVAGMAQKS